MSADLPVVDAGAIRENKLELVERLADDLAHEIKNPLHSMGINLEVLRRRLVRLDPAPTDDLLRYTTVLGTELERVNRRIDLLLRMVRPQRDSEDLATIGEVLEELRELVEIECQRYKTDLVMVAPPGIARPYLPRAATRQMLLGLILDMLDASAGGGSLAVEAQEDSRTVSIRILASGHSESPVLDRPSEETTYLSVARSLAERLGGRLEILADTPDGPAEVGYLLTLPQSI